MNFAESTGKMNYNLTSAREIQNIIDQTVFQVGRTDILVNNLNLKPGKLFLELMVFGNDLKEIKAL